VRILLVNAHGDPAVGGAEKHVAELAAELDRRGHDVDLLQAYPDDGPPGFAGTRTVVHSAHWRTSEVRRVRSHLGDLVVPLRRTVRELIDSRSPDVVHTHNLPGLGTGVWEISRRRGIPVVHTLHDYYLVCPRVTLTRRDGRPCCPAPAYCALRARRLARFGAAVGDVVGVSRYVLARQAHVFPAARQHVIRNPATPAHVASRPPGEQLRHLGFIGTLDPVKGVRVILEAAPELARRGCTVTLAGTGQLEAEVRAAADRGEVRLVGHVSGSAKSAFFDGCDLGLVPSLWDEPAPYTPVEWLASGRPVLLPARGGLGEMLETWTGAIAVDATPEAIVAEVDRLLDPAAWREAVARVRPVDSAGAFTAWADAHEALYDEAAGPNTRNAPSRPPRARVR
jgi:glycosyltransferase involved in cell wall biosynthesis